MFKVNAVFSQWTASYSLLFFRMSVQTGFLFEWLSFRGGKVFISNETIYKRMEQKSFFVHIKFNSKVNSKSSETSLIFKFRSEKCSLRLSRIRPCHSNSGTGEENCQVSQDNIGRQCINGRTASTPRVWLQWTISSKSIQFKMVTKKSWTIAGMYLSTKPLSPRSTSPFPHSPLRDNLSKRRDAVHVLPRNIDFFLSFNKPKSTKLRQLCKVTFGAPFEASSN